MQFEDYRANPIQKIIHEIDESGIDRSIGVKENLRRLNKGIIEKFMSISDCLAKAEDIQIQK